MCAPLAASLGVGPITAALPPIAAGVSAGEGPVTVLGGLSAALVFAGLVLCRVVRMLRSLGLASAREASGVDARRTRAPSERRADDPPHPGNPRAPDLSPAGASRRDAAAVDALADALGAARRRRVAGERLGRELAPLAEAGWLIERDVQAAGGRVPWLVLGTTGVFALDASDGRWTLDGLAALAKSVQAAGERLPGYRGPLVAATVLAFDEFAPRSWFGGAALDGRGGWVLGLDWLLPWMFSFGRAAGLAATELERLRRAAESTSSRSGSARLPGVQQFG